MEEKVKKKKALGGLGCDLILAACPPNFGAPKKVAEAPRRCGETDRNRSRFSLPRKARGKQPPLACEGSSLADAPPDLSDVRGVLRVPLS